MKIFMRLLKKKPRELNFTKIRRSKCSVNLKSRTAVVALYRKKYKKKKFFKKLKVEEIKCRVTSTSRGFELQIS